MVEIKYAPREIFDEILKWMVVPTFDLIIESEGIGALIVKRKIAPYKNQWALPGLRMYKGEEIDDVIERIAKNELNLIIDPKKRTFLGQFVGKFKTEHHRQDISTGYLIKTQANLKIETNEEHFSSYKYINSIEEIPAETGAMYKHYLQNYFRNRKG